MELAVKRHIQIIGHDFDQGIFPNILDGGVLIPGARPVASTLGKERVHHGQQSRQTKPPRPAPPSGASAAPGASAASRYAWTSGDAAQVTRATADLEDEIDTLKRAYPGTRAYHQAHGVWLQIPCAVLHGLGYSAIFLVALNTSLCQASAWGFWVAGNIGACWIGDRHTNYADGSICAFDGRDGTWQFGGSLITLADLYAMWAFRHLHLQISGHWPGPQSAERRLERVYEFQPNEQCGCDTPSGTYANCCMAKDKAAEFTPGLLEHTVIRSNISYALERQNRRPPAVIAKLATEASGNHVFPEFTPNLVDWMTEDWIRNQAC